MKKRIKIGIAGVAVMTVVTIFHFLTLSSSAETENVSGNRPGATSYPEALKMYSESINEKDFQKILTVSPAPLRENENAQQKYAEIFESEFENVSSYEYEISRICEIPIECFENYVGEIKKEMEENFGGSVEIDDAIEVIIDVEYTFDDGSEDIAEQKTLFAFKSDGRWFLTEPYIPEIIGC